MDRWMPVEGTTSAEVETTFRWDDEQRTLQACTASSRVANRWKAAGFPVLVMGRTKDGQPRTWSVDLPWSGRKGDWTRLFSRAVPGYQAPQDPAAKVA